MRIRSIKPEFWRSSDISKLSIEDRLLFVGLWSYVDDNGVGVDKLAAITADLFADDLEREAPETFARVSRGLQNLSEAGRIIRYTVDNTKYLSITNWGKHQRIDKPGKPRFPRPDAENVEIRESVARVSEKVAPGTEEQGNRGTGDKDTCPPATPSSVSDPANRFEEFWNAYPRKVGKQKAATKYKAAIKRSSEDAVIDGAHRLANDPNLPEQTFIPHPTTWLERDGWNDEPLPARFRTGSEQRLAVGYELTQRAVSRATESNVFPFKELNR